MPSPKRFNKGSTSAPEGALQHFRSHPCRVFSFSYGSRAPFHGGNTGSNPVGDANLFNIAQISCCPDYDSFFYLQLSSRAAPYLPFSR